MEKKKQNNKKDKKKKPDMNELAFDIVNKATEDKPKKQDKKD